MNKQENQISLTEQYPRSLKEIEPPMERQQIYKKKLGHPLISVVIPVYGVEDYVEKCLDSVIGQTYKNLEILCIDDCGIDHSIEIVKDKSKLDNRIKIIQHKKNRGLSAARNTGVERAIGEYVFFIDSDDYISPEFIEGLVEAIDKSDADFAYNENLIKIYKEKKKKRHRKKIKLNPGVYRITKELQKMMVTAWCKLYRKRFLEENDLKYIEGFMFEDMLFHHEAMMVCKKVAISTKGNYFHRRFGDSYTLTHHLKDKEVFDEIEIYKAICNLYKEEGQIENTLSLGWLMRYFCRYSGKSQEKFYHELKKLFQAFDTTFLATRTMKEMNMYHAVINGTVVDAVRVTKRTLKKNRWGKIMKKFGWVQ
jgi:glycosyltransferase involved in cell wall biosynthesis